MGHRTCICLCRRKASVKVTTSYNSRDAKRWVSGKPRPNKWRASRRVRSSVVLIICEGSCSRWDVEHPSVSDYFDLCYLNLRRGVASAG